MDKTLDVNSVDKVDQLVNTILWLGQDSEDEILKSKLANNPELRNKQRDVITTLVKTAMKHNIDPLMFAGVAMQESAWGANVGDETSTRRNIFQMNKEAIKSMKDFFTKNKDIADKDTYKFFANLDVDKIMSDQGEIADIDTAAELGAYFMKYNAMQLFTKIGVDPNAGGKHKQTAAAIWNKINTEGLSSTEGEKGLLWKFALAGHRGGYDNLFKDSKAKTYQHKVPISKFSSLGQADTVWKNALTATDKYNFDFLDTFKAGQGTHIEETLGEYTNKVSALHREYIANPLLQPVMAEVKQTLAAPKIDTASLKDVSQEKAGAVIAEAPEEPIQETPKPIEKDKKELKKYTGFGSNVLKRLFSLDTKASTKRRLK